MSSTSPMVHLARGAVIELLEQLRTNEQIQDIREGVAWMRQQLLHDESPLHAAPDVPLDSCITVRQEYLLRELDQIERARSIERAHYYLSRLLTGITHEQTNGINDINLNRWKEYEDIYTESLWQIERRDRSGAHAADYWGNFIPQIPHQMMRRYTKAGDWVLDPFAGLGTTLIEGQRLGRHTIGIELQAHIAERARARLDAERTAEQHTICNIHVGDCLATDYAALLGQYGQQSVQLVILHPPYFDIISFSDDARDFSNAPSCDAFIEKMGQLVGRVGKVLQHGRYLVLVIGDKYSRGEWIPLGFLTMQTIMRRGFRLKSIIVKNFEQTTAKRTQQALWRYRALRGGFYVFKHEYIFLFQHQQQHQQ